VLEQLAALPSMRRIIIFDTKSADLTMMLAAAGRAGASAAEAAFSDRVEIRVFTFGTDHGWKATLSNLADMAQKDDYNPVSLDDRSDWRLKVHQVIKGVLIAIGLVVVDDEAKLRMVDPLLPAALKHKGGFNDSLNPRMQTQIGQNVADGIVHLIQTNAGAPLPRSFRELADVVDPSNHPHGFKVSVGLEPDDFS
jgi:hypothetical protein